MDDLEKIIKYIEAYGKEKANPSNKAILKTQDGLVQLYKCPKCGYWVTWNDALFKNNGHFVDVVSCVDCAEKSEPAKTEAKTPVRHIIKEELESMEDSRVSIGFQFQDQIFDYMTCDGKGKIAISDEFAKAIHNALDNLPAKCRQKQEGED
jgi:ssDNA-binding Zn-finger/Zn-ribbon topoisomerase 1